MANSSTESIYDYVWEIEHMDPKDVLAMRDLRKRLWENEAVDRLDRTVLSLTGSLSQFLHFKAMSARLSRLRGQPAVHLGYTHDPDPKLAHAEGGIITGSLMPIEDVLFQPSRGQRGQARAMLAVPVKRRIKGSFYPDGRLQFSAAAPRSNTADFLIIATLNTNEPKPSEESTIESDTRIHEYGALLGHEAIAACGIDTPGFTAFIQHINETN